MNPYSNLKVFHHHELLERIQEEKPVAPIYIRLKPTNVCNHHCAYCTYGSGNTFQKTENRNMVNHRDIIPWEKMHRIINDMGDMGVKAVTLSGGGEPLTYPNICETLTLLKERGIETSLITNGELLDGKISECFYDAAWVRISFDSPIKEDYCNLRGLTPERYERVVSNIASFAKKKSKNCVLGINYVVNKSNYKNIYMAAELLKDLGVDNVKIAAVIDNKSHYHDDIKSEAISQIKKAQNELADLSFQVINNYEKDCEDKNFIEQPYERCFTCQMITVIGADSRIYLCHTRAYDSQAVLGDLHDFDLKELWFSREVQNKLHSLNPREECKNYCAYEGRNVLLNDYYNTNQHLNFI
jgi:MoaA/NifB/PqqE/SkfB family radical SAM enzyme